MVECMTEALKYPVGDFTQSDLAELNGVAKLEVYLPLKEALEKGIIIKTGTRPTGHRPSNVYRVSVPIQPLVVVIPSSAPASAPTAPPPTPPLASEPGHSCPKGTDAVLKPLTLYSCPLCGGSMVVIRDQSGVWVRCHNVPCDPAVHETVFGHGKNAGAAYAIACEKYKKTPSAS